MSAPPTPSPAASRCGCKAGCGATSTTCIRSAAISRSPAAPSTSICRGGDAGGDAGSQPLILKTALASLFDSHRSRRMRDRKILIITDDAGECFEILYAQQRFREAGYQPV